MRSKRVLGPALLALIAVGAFATATPTEAAPLVNHKKDGYREYVALGDSWTADVVVLNGDGTPDDTYAPVDCAQSHHNYPKIVAATIGVATFRDASCGSATTDDFANPQTGLPAGGTNPPQFDRLTKKTDLVTVGIGGNDAGIASAGLDCLNAVPVDNRISDSGYGKPFGGCKAKYVKDGHDELSERIQASEPKLVAAFQAIHQISPKARILAIDYIGVVPDHGCYPTVPASDTDMQYIHDKFVELNAMVQRAAAAGGAEFVPTYDYGIGHDMCQLPTVRYAEVYGLSVNDPAVGVPAHPNAAGARAQAAAVLEYLRTH
jgi:lysophospholipase L1-like esterase